MNLDLPTLMVTESFVAVCAGVALLIAWWGDRKTIALALWGQANLLVAAGIFSLVLGSALHQPLFFMLAANLLVLAQGLVWKAARSFDGKPAPLVFAVLGLLIVGLASAIPAMKDVTGSLGLALSAGYLFAAAVSLWHGRTERLPARVPIIGFTAVHVGVLLIGAYSMLTGDTATDQIPQLLSPFGIVHFETIIFSIGTAVFILALVKERNEAASRIAAAIDSLTGIANRAAFMEAAGRVLERCRKDKAPLSVIMFDLDGFKAINDTHGHALGDAVIRRFCAVTAAALRPNDVFGRLGGEEFAVVLPRSSIEPAYVRAERIRATFADDCHIVDDHHVNATVSGGVSVSLDAEMTLSKLLEISDGALYRAKAAGRNRIKRADQLAPEGGLSSVIRVA